MIELDVHQGAAGVEVKWLIAEHLGTSEKLLLSAFSKERLSVAPDFEQTLQVFTKAPWN